MKNRMRGGKTPFPPKNRNAIKDYRRQDLQPVERTQELKPEKEKRTCKLCNGTGEHYTGSRNAAFPVDCERCGGEGVI